MYVIYTVGNYVTDNLTCERVCGRFHLHMYTGWRGRRGGWMAGSFVECGLILMGTDDKQRKQASSLPGEICLLLPACSGAIHGNVASLSSSIFHPLGSHLNDHHGSTQLRLYRAHRKYRVLKCEVGLTLPRDRLDIRVCNCVGEQVWVHLQLYYYYRIEYRTTDLSRKGGLSSSPSLNLNEETIFSSGN